MMKLVEQVLVGTSHSLELEAALAKSKPLQITLNCLGTLTKLLSFSDFSRSVLAGEKVLGPSVIGALGITAASVIDDILIASGLYEKHHLAKVGCAAYAGYKLATVENCFGHMPYDAALFGACFAGATYALGSDDMFGTVRSNMTNLSEFSHRISKLTDAQLDLTTAFRVAAVSNGVLGGARQYMKDLNLELGGALNAPVGSAVSFLAGWLTKEDYTNKFLKVLPAELEYKLGVLTPKQFEELKKDPTTKKILMELPSCLSKAAGGLSQAVIKSSTKMGYEQLMASAYAETGAGKHHDLGFNLFVIANLINKGCTKPKAKPFQSYEHDFERDDITKGLKNIQKPSTEKLDTVAWMILPILLNDLYLNAIYNKADDTYKHLLKFSAFSSCTSIVDDSLASLLTMWYGDGEKALSELEYLSHKIEEATMQY